MSEVDLPFPDDAPVENPTPSESSHLVPDILEPKPKRQGNYKNANYHLPELNDEQKAFIAAHWANPEWDLKRITRHVWNNALLDGHHAEGKSVRAYIATLGSDPSNPAKPRTTANPAKKGRFELTPEQQTNVIALLNQENPPTTKEIFKTIFAGVKDFSPLSQEYQAVCRFIKATNEEGMDIWDEPVAERRYKPPGSWSILLGMVNKCVGNPNDINKALYDPAKMKPAQERNIKALFSYMKVDKFVLKASQYDKRADRDLFISTFIRNVQDKASDLMPDEVDSFIELAAESIYVAQLERDIMRHERQIGESLDGDDDENGSKAKLSMSLVESTNSLRDKIKAAKDYILKLRSSVAGSRKDRLESKINKNDHVGNWLNLWVQEETRKDLIEMAKKEHEEDAAEYGRIKTMDDSWALIAGMTKEEAAGAP